VVRKMLEAGRNISVKLFRSDELGAALTLIFPVSEK
jgi:hypothetical protein